MSKRIADFKDVADLAGSTKDDLLAAIEDGYGQLDPILDNEAPTAAEVAQAKELHAEIKRLEQRVADIEAEDASIAAEMEQMRADRAVTKAGVQPPAPEEADEAEGDDEADEADSDEPEGDEAEAESTEGEIVLEEIDAATGEVTVINPDPAEVIVEVTPERELVTASSAAPKTAGRRPVAPPKENTVEKPKVLIRAAADTGIRPAGDGMTGLRDVADVAVHRFGQLRGQSGNVTLGIAQFERPVADGLEITDAMSDEQMDAVAEYATSESRLSGGSLVAAAGDGTAWCGPLENILDICEGGTTQDLWDVPGIRASRGGVRYLKSVDYSPLYAANADPGKTAAGWYYTEAQVKAGTKKVCIEVPCPEFTDLILDAAGVCVTSSLLTSTAFPEWVRKFVSEALIAHEINVSAALLNKAVTAAGTKLVATDVKSTATNTLTAVELIIENQREQNHWGRQTLEVVMPHWVKAAMRADLAERNGVDLLAVTDAQINAYFGVRQARPQFVLGFEPLPKDSVVFPKTFTALIYRAGTFAKLFRPIINLGVFYDSTLLEVNKATQLFTEEGVALMEKCYGAKAVTIPVCSSGITGAASNAECYVAKA